jgi:hypothetical protein
MCGYNYLEKIFMMHVRKNSLGGGKPVHVIFKYLFTNLFPSLSVDISFEDDVTVILLLDVSFMAPSKAVADVSYSVQYHTYWPTANKKSNLLLIF